MELLLLILLVVVVLALVGGVRGPAIYGRRTRGPVVRDTVYEDDPVVVEEVVEDGPVDRTRRRIVDY